MQRMNRPKLNEAHKLDLIAQHDSEAMNRPDQKALERFISPAYSTLGYLEKKKVDVKENISG